ncbi:hypothetical protein Hanom_Chr09g00766121 [Helianthus anomalus]
MGSYSYESMSQISERIFQENQYPEPKFSTNQQTPSGSLNSRSKSIKNTFKKKKNQVFLEGYVVATDEDDLVRAKSLTDEDLDELKGCFDLGFGFSYDEIPELCNTLPALELCYSMSQKFLDDQKWPEVSPPVEETVSPPPAPIASLKISSPGEFFFNYYF